MPQERRAASELQAKLRSGQFVITAEITPPVSTDPAEFLRRAMPLKGLATAHFLVQSGIEPIFQMTFSAEQAGVVAEIFGLTAEEQRWLTVVPCKGSLATSVPTDPLIYRFYELISVYGTTFKELIHEEFGDGIMSAIDFSMSLTREPDPKGDRVRITMSGKFLPYRTY